MSQNNRNIEDLTQEDYDKMVNYARKHLKDEGSRDAQDVIQDVMLTVYDTASRINRPIENLAGYLYQAIRNRIVDTYRKRKEKTVSIDEMTSGENGLSMHDILADLRYNTHNEVEKKEIQETLFKAVETLSPEQKAIWIATEIDEIGFEELSMLWNVPVGTLLSRKHRAVASLREKLKGIVHE